MLWQIVGNSILQNKTFYFGEPPFFFFFFFCIFLINFLSDGSMKLAHLQTKPNQKKEKKNF
jgi:hypothetical protein